MIIKTVDKRRMRIEEESLELFSVARQLKVRSQHHVQGGSQLQKILLKFKELNL